MNPRRRVTPILRPPGARARLLVAAVTVLGVLLAPPGGPAGAATTDVITVTPERGRQDGNSGSPSISGDGRYVAFSSVATNLVPDDTNGTSDVFVRDRSTGVTRRASVASNGVQSDGDARDPVISRDGRYVAFVSDATNLVPGNGRRSFQVNLHDLATRQTSLVSVAIDGARASGDCRPGFAAPAIVADGGWIAFGCDATNLVNDGKGAGMFLRDRLAGLTIRASVDADGLPVTDTTAAFLSLSASGQVLAF